MSLFNVFSKNINTEQQNIVEENKNGEPIKTIENSEENTAPPEEIFIEKDEPNLKFLESKNDKNKGIDLIYDFLNTDFNNRGQSDALGGSDEKIKTNGINILKHELKIIIHKAILFNEKTIKDLESSILILKNNGLLQSAEEKRTELEKHKLEISNIRDIEEDVNSDTGLYKRVISSYEQGFLKGTLSLIKAKIQD